MEYRDLAEERLFREEVRAWLHANKPTDKRPSDDSFADQMAYGALVSPAVAEEFARRLKDCRLIKLGDGVHFLQEDHPATIGRSVAAFIGEIKARNAKTAA